MKVVVRVGAFLGGGREGDFREEGVGYGGGGGGEGGAGGGADEDGRAVADYSAGGLVALLMGLGMGTD